MIARVLLAATVVVLSPLRGWAQAPSAVPRQQGGPPGVTAPSPERAPAAAPVTGSGIIRGHTLRADTGAALARVYVALSRQGGEQRAVSSDDRGAYEFRNLPPGRYQVLASKPGYEPTRYGTKGRATTIDVADQANDAVDLSLPPGGVIEGTVVDANGEPMEDVQVATMRMRYVNGERVLEAEQQGEYVYTDDLGHFRVFGLSAGSHYVSASFHSLDNIPHPPTYYPGTFSPSEAQPIVLAAGQEVGGLTVQFAPSQLFTVSGTVVSSKGRPATVASVSLATSGAARISLGGPAASRGLDGAFSIVNVPPGTYRLRVQTTEKEAIDVPVAVGDADVSLSLITLAPETARGRIIFDGNVVPSQIKPDMVSLNFAPSYESGAPSLLQGGIRVSQDWSFESSPLIGSAFIRGVSRAPAANGADPWMLKRILRRGVDVTDALIDFAGGVDDLEVVLTTRVTFVSGRVSDSKGAPVRDADVVIFADDRDKWRPPTRFVRIARPNQAGDFSASSLPPGRYLVAALDAIDTGDEQNPAFLESLRQKATPVTLGDGETKSVDVKLVNP